MQQRSWTVAGRLLELRLSSFLPAKNAQVSEPRRRTGPPPAVSTQHSLPCSGKEGKRSTNECFQGPTTPSFLQVALCTAPPLQQRLDSMGDVPVHKCQGQLRCCFSCQLASHTAASLLLTYRYLPPDSCRPAKPTLAVRADVLRVGDGLRSYQAASSPLTPCIRSVQGAPPLKAARDPLLTAAGSSQPDSTRQQFVTSPATELKEMAKARPLGRSGGNGRQAVCLT